MCLAHPTGAARLAAVIRAIKVMRAGIAQPLSLRELAHAAMLSPFHFHRVFRHVTATTPARYLTALRMAEAKRLLARSALNITEICGEVGYASLGTFTNQFTRLVGLSPRSFRELMAELGDRPIVELLDPLMAQAHADRLGCGGGDDGGRAATLDTGSIGALDGGPAATLDGGPVGTIAGGPAGGGLAIVGLFDSGVPARRPAACTLVPSPGLATFGPTPDGIYHLLAILFTPTATVAQALADHRAPVRYVGTDRWPVVVRDGRMAVSFDVMLRRPRFTDPPMVMALLPTIPTRNAYARYED